jgi:hypothetical protein
MYSLQGSSEENLSTPPSQNLHFSCTASTNHKHATYAQATKTFYTPIEIDDVQYINQPHQQNYDVHEIKNMVKGIFEQMGTMLNLLTTVLNKLK